jgi:hypothetical protein
VNGLYVGELFWAAIFAEIANNSYFSMAGAQRDEMGFLTDYRQIV